MLVIEVRSGKFSSLGDSDGEGVLTSLRSGKNAFSRNRLSDVVVVQE